MNYFLDTNICVALLRNQNQKLTQKFLSQDQKLIKISAIVAAELLYGADKSSNKEKNLKQVEEFLAKDSGYNGDAMVIVGHTPIQKLFIENNSVMFDAGYIGKFLIANTQKKNIKIQPYKVPNRNILMMDTGSYMEDGKISCVDILSGEFWQS